MIRAQLVIITALTLTAACKKKPQVENPVPVATPETIASEETVPTEPETPAEPEKSAEELAKEAAESIRQEIDAAVASVGTSATRTDRDAARSKLQAVLARDPANALAMLNIGALHHQDGSYAQASKHYQQATAAQPDLGQAWLYLGFVKMDEGNVDGAIKTWRTGLLNAPEYAGLYAGLVEGLRRQGKLDDALDMGMKGLRVNSKSLELFNNMGLVYLDMGDPVRAKFVFEQALLVPGGQESAELNTNRAQGFAMQGLTPEAVQLLEKANALDPNYVPALLLLADLYMQNRRYAETVPLLEKAIERKAESADLQLTLGVAYRGIKRFDDAQRAYERALTLDPANPAPHLNLGILLGDYLKKYEDALSAYEAYKSAGGEQTELVEEYIKATKREKKKADRAKKRAEDRKRKAEEAAKAADLAKQFEEQQSKNGTGTEGDGGEQPADSQTPPQEPTPDGGEQPADGASPWGDQQGGGQ